MSPPGGRERYPPGSADIRAVRRDFEKRMKRGDGAAFHAFRAAMIRGPEKDAAPLPERFACGRRLQVGIELFHALVAFEPGAEDAEFVQEVHRHGHDEHGGRVGSGGEDEGEDEDGGNGIGARAAHQLVGEDAEFDEGDDEDGQFEGDAEHEDELGGEGEVVADAPVVFDAHADGVFVEEAQDARQDDEVGEGAARQKEAEAEGDAFVDEAAFVVHEARHDELQQEEHQQGEGDDEASVEGHFEREHEGFAGLEGAHEFQGVVAVAVAEDGSFAFEGGGEVGHGGGF